MLLVFPKSNDPQCTAFADAVYRMNLSCYYATSDEDARIAYIGRSHSIVIIDTRAKKLLDGLALCRSLVLVPPPTLHFFFFVCIHIATVQVVVTYADGSRVSIAIVCVCM